MLDSWRVIECSPDAHDDPGDLEPHWAGAPVMPAPTTVAAALGAEHTDDYDYWCRTQAHFARASRIEFSGLSFPATVYLDGVEVQRCESMFLPVTVDVPPGDHTVTVRFSSITQWLKTRRPRGRWRSGLVSQPGLRWARTTLIGRAPVYGKLPAPVGFWRPVTVRTSPLLDLTLIADPATGVAEVNGVTDLASGSVTLSVRDPADDRILDWNAVLDDGAFAAHLIIDDPQLWWPRGYGAQPMYELAVEIDEKPIAKRKFGFRSVENSGDEEGFRLSVNRTPVFCRGVNWTPPDPVRLTATEAVVREHLESFAGAGANMVRVVGGLVYEQPEFWSVCAELGLMVWQDAMQSTFDPPDEVGQLMLRELQGQLDAVSGNPALTVVSGGSETLQRPEMMGMPKGSFDIDVIDVQMPKLVANGAGVPYVPSSPAPPADGNHLAIRPDTGVAHWFGVGGYLRPLADVERAGVRFAAECLAFSIPPSPAAVEHHFGSSAVAGHDPAWKAGVPRDRGASWDFEDVRDFYVSAIFGEDPVAVRRTDPDRYLQLGRLAVAEAMRSCFAFWRRGDSRCSGALVLTGKDMVPGAGWGLLDADGQPKAALEVLRRIWAPTTVTITEAGLSGLRIDIHNDSPSVKSGELRLVAVTPAGHRLVEAQVPLTAPAHGSVTLYDSEVTGVFRDLSHSFAFGTPAAQGVQVTVALDDEPQVLRDVIVVAPGGVQTHCGMRAAATPATDRCWDLTVSTDVALRYVSIEAPGWHPADNYFHLLPGLAHTVRLWPAGEHTEPSGWISSIDAMTPESITVTS